MSDEANEHIETVKAVLRKTFQLPSAMDDLRSWIAANRPDLGAELAALPLYRALGVLNRETGLDVAGTDPIEAGAKRFLAALRHDHAMRGVL